MYTFCIIMICIASILLILAVLVQSPKSGMAANFGAANQTMGVRQTTDFLEKFTWAMVAAIVFFSLLSTTALPGRVEAKSEDTTAAATENVEFKSEETETPVMLTEGSEVTEDVEAAELPVNILNSVEPVATSEDLEIEQSAE